MFYVIDLTTNRLYWIDAKLHIIVSTDLDGMKRELVFASNKFLGNPFAITVFEEWLYWTDWHTKSIYRLNKLGHGNVTNVMQKLHHPMDIHIFHSLAQPAG